MMEKIKSTSKSRKGFTSGLDTEHPKILSSKQHKEAILTTKSWLVKNTAE